MINKNQFIEINGDLARRLISDQFLEYAHLPIISVDKQGHDNRIFRLGMDMLIRLPREEAYAIKVPIEQALLPKIAPYLTLNIPAPIKMGHPSKYYPFSFSIYKWLLGTSINLLILNEQMKLDLAYDLANFLKELQSIPGVDGPAPGQHNWWRGDHPSIYDQGARKQIAQLSGVINENKALELWHQACQTKWDKPPVWVHGDFWISNMLFNGGKLFAIIDFGGIAIGDPACDLVIAWTYLDNRSRENFIEEMNLDDNTWLRARGWALWKATYELCNIKDKHSPEAMVQRKLVEEVCCQF